MTVIWRDDFTGSAGSINGRVNSTLMWTGSGGPALDGAGKLSFATSGNCYVDMPSSMFPVGPTFEIELGVTIGSSNQFDLKFCAPFDSGSTAIPSTSNPGAGMSWGAGFSVNVVAWAPGTTTTVGTFVEPFTGIIKVAYTTGATAVSVYKNGVFVGFATSSVGNQQPITSTRRLYMYGAYGSTADYIEVRTPTVAIPPNFWTELKGTVEIP